MKPLITATFCLFSFSAQADLIVYTYDAPIVSPDPDHQYFDAYGSLTVDTQKRRLVSFNFVSEPVRFNWQGEAALTSPEPVSPGTFATGFETVYIPDQGAGFSLWLDRFTLEEGQDLFENLDRTAPYEGAFVYSGYPDYYLTGGLTKTKTIKVPEPATLSLLALGLAAIGIRRRLR